MFFLSLVILLAILLVYEAASFACLMPCSRSLVPSKRHLGESRFRGSGSRSNVKQTTRTCLKFLPRSAGRKLIEHGMVNERYLHILDSLSQTGLYFRTPGTKSWVTSSTAAIHTRQGQKHGGLRPMDLTLVKNKKLQFWPEIPGQVHTSTVSFAFWLPGGLPEMKQTCTSLIASYNPTYRVYRCIIPVIII